MDWFAKEGSPYPLGCTWLSKDQAFNFALYSKHATGVELLLYDSEETNKPVYSYELNPAINKSERVWHCRVDAGRVPNARYYAYRVTGPSEPHAGHRFNPKKILLDPYARSVYFPQRFSRDRARDGMDNAGAAPLGVLLRTERKPVNDKRPTHTNDLIIYELHVRQFTRNPNSGVPEPIRGTFLGIVDKIPYLKELGITAVELMPVAQQDPQEGSCWGYMPLALFATHHGYASCSGTEGVLEEFKQMVRALHRAGIEVILDVVYNHTCEGDSHGPTYSFRGIDNSTYYLLDGDREQYRNDSGTGNTLNFANRYVRKMIVESLLFWTNEMGVDGFRFDLASLFTRREDGSINTEDPPVIEAISGLVELEGIRLIAEAWDPVAYQLGRTFPGTSWLQWNGRFRDDVRAFVRGDHGSLGLLATRLYGSSDLFPDDLANAYHAYQSINFVDCHDGFCLYDVVAYERKHNEGNGQANRDGTDANFSSNWGGEGDEDVPEDVSHLRQRLVRFFFAILLLSNGTPMFRAGDEFLHTQRGNNNPFNQDNETTWLDWARLRRFMDTFTFAKNMIAFRRNHPSISRSRFWRGDVRWYGPTGRADFSASSRALAYCLHGSSEHDDDLYVMVNGGVQAICFSIQEQVRNGWRVVVDTHAGLVAATEQKAGPWELQMRECLVQPHSIIVLMSDA